jgi:hypothetical protein
MRSDPVRAVEGRAAVLTGLVPEGIDRPAAATLLAFQVVSLLAMTLLVVTRYWQDHVWLGFTVFGLAALVWLPELTRPRMRRWWFFYVGGTFLYTLLRAFADETSIPIRTGYIIDADRVLFFGAVPSEWLQARFFDVDGLRLHDYIAVALHWSFFVAPHAAAVGIFVWRRDLFPRYAAILVGTLWAGLLLFFLLPTRPPWMAAELGRLTGVERVMDYVGGTVHANAYSSLYRSLGEPNSVAAVPSIHMGITFAMFLWSRAHAPRLAVPLLGYSLLMGLALVYLGEHYVADLLIGIVCALILVAVTRPLFPPRTERKPGGADGASPAPPSP